MNTSVRKKFQPHTMPKETWSYYPFIEIQFYNHHKDLLLQSLQRFGPVIIIVIQSCSHFRDFNSTAISGTKIQPIVLQTCLTQGLDLSSIRKKVIQILLEQRRYKLISREDIQISIESRLGHTYIYLPLEVEWVPF